MSEKTSTSPLKKQQLNCEFINLSHLSSFSSGKSILVTALIDMKPFGSATDLTAATTTSISSSPAIGENNLVSESNLHIEKRDALSKSYQTIQSLKKRDRSSPSSSPPVSTASSLSSSSNLIPLSGLVVRAWEKFDTSCKMKNVRENALKIFRWEV